MRDRRRTHRAWLTALLLTHCAFDFGRFTRVGDGGATTADGAMLPPDPATFGGACPLPALHVAAEYLGNDSRDGARVVRWSLQADGTALPCGALRSMGYLPPLARAVAAHSPTRIGLAGRESFSSLEPTPDRLLRSGSVNAQTDTEPFALTTLEYRGDRVFAVLLHRLTSGLSPVSYLWLANDRGEQVTTFSPTATGSSLYQMSVVDLVQSPNPRTPTHMLAVPFRTVPSTTPWVVDAEMDVTRRSAVTTVVPASGEYIPWTVAASSDGRVAMVLQVPGAASGTALAFSPETGQPAQLLPTCSVGDCGSAGSEYFHVVPDPTSRTRFYAVCGNAERHVVQLRTDTNECISIGRDADLPGRYRFWRLAVATNL